MKWKIVFKEFLYENNSVIKKEYMSEKNNNKNSNIYFIILIIICIILNIFVIMPIHSINMSAKTMIWLIIISIILITNLLFIEFYFQVKKEQEEKHNK